MVAGSTSDRIEVLRVILILGIVLIHIPPPLEVPGPDPAGGTWFGAVRLFLSGALFLGAVPTLSVISGYLFFIRQRRESYARIVRVKAGRLVLPLVLWNLPFFAAALIMQQAGLTDHVFRLAALDPRVALDATLALTRPPMNPPLYFLRDLFVCFLLAPPLAFGLRRYPWPTFVLLFAVVVFPLDIYVLIRTDILLAFYVGGLVATGRIRLAPLERWGLWPFAAYVGLCAVVALHGLQMIDAEDAPLWNAAHPVLRLLGPIAFWGLAGALLHAIGAPHWRTASRRSYLVFLGHAPILMLLWLSTGGAIPFPLFYIAAPLATVALLVLLYELLHRASPGTLRVLTGRLAPRPRGGVLP